MAARFRLAVAAALALLAQSCDEPEFEIRAGRISGPYYLTIEFLGVGSGRAICYQVVDGPCRPRTMPGVVKVGANDDFISAAVRIIGDPDNLEYYFIVREFDSPRADNADAVRGPFDEKEFRKLRHKHGLPLPVRFRVWADPGGS